MIAPFRAESAALYNKITRSMPKELALLPEDSQNLSHQEIFDIMRSRMKHFDPVRVVRLEALKHAAVMVSETLPT